jgi:VCBS repeat-containing protein
MTFGADTWASAPMMLASAPTVANVAAANAAAANATAVNAAAAANAPGPGDGIALDLKFFSNPIDQMTLISQLKLDVDFFTTVNTQLRVSGTLDRVLGPGDTAQVHIDKDVGWIDLSSAQAPVGGSSWVYSTPAGRVFSDGLHTFDARIENAAGNVSSAQTVSVVIDTERPDIVVDITGISTDSGKEGDFITNDKNGLTVNASLTHALDETERLTYSRDGGMTWADITDAVKGTTVSLFDGDLTATSTLRMRVVDLAGNAGATDTQKVVIDTATPTTQVEIESISVDSGSPNDFITNDNDGLTITAKLTSALGPDERLEYSRAGSPWIDITSSVKGTVVNYADAGLTSTGVIQMRVVNGAGNPGVADSQLITIDTLRGVADADEAAVGLVTVIDSTPKILGEESVSIGRGGVAGNAKAYDKGVWTDAITFKVEDGAQMKVAIEGSIKTEVPLLEQHLTIYVTNQETHKIVATIEYKDPLWEGGSWYNGLPIGPGAKSVTLGEGTYSIQGVYTDGWLLDIGAPANTARIAVTQTSLTYKEVDVNTAEGNILANDSTGVSFASLEVDGAGTPNFVKVTGQGVDVRGAYGTLHVETDGDYLYTPDKTLAAAGKVDEFDYHLMRADGSYESATLSIDILDQLAQQVVFIP